MGLYTLVRADLLNFQIEGYFADDLVSLTYVSPIMALASNVNSRITPPKAGILQFSYRDTERASIAS
jgi:hypothetical protein